MKRNKFILLVLLAGAMFFTTSCEKFLDEEPTDRIEGETAIQNATDMNRAILGAYSGLQSGNYYGLRYLLYQDVYADNLQHSGTFTTDQEVSNRVLNPSNLQLLNTWASIYSVINRCNIILRKAPGIPDLDAAGVNNAIGEARFMRALAYYDLLRVFGGVPLKLEATEFIAEITTTAKSTETQVYDQIISDLIFAETNITANAATTRASRLAATALLARVYLQRGDNANALTKANQVITTSPYVLQTSFVDIFTRERTAESIFELDFTINDQNGLASSSDPSTSGQRFYWRTAFFNTFQTSGTSGDTRFAASAVLQSTRRRQIKYFRLGSNDDNVPLIRLAEMFLIRAEATARLADQAAAPAAQVLSDINRIRNRSGLANAAPATNAAALTEILNQRRLEFAAEGHRFTDMKRFGVAATLFPAGQSFRLLWPIPLTEIENNPNLVQNPGY